MKNATYVDQCDTIRTLTEEEMAVVSGGLTQQQIFEFTTGQFYDSPQYRRFASSSIRVYTPQSRSGYLPSWAIYNAALPIQGMLSGMFGIW